MTKLKDIIKITVDTFESQKKEAIKRALSESLYPHAAEPPFCIECRHATASRCADCLPVMRVLHISSCKDTLNIRQSRALFNNDITGLIQFELIV